jgi:protein SCO1/2
MRHAALVVVVCLLTGPACAGLTKADLAAVAADPPPGARLDLALSAVDAQGHRRTLGDILQGRTAFVAFADYTCNSLCGTVLGLLSGAIAGAHLAPSQYRIVVLGLDPKDPPRAALAMAAAEIPRAQQAAASFLLPDAATVARTTAALGFRYVYDPASDQFAHPAVFYVVGGDGTVRTVMSPFTLTPGAIRNAIAPQGAIPRLREHLRILCYAYDPATGRYSLRILVLLKWAGVVTVLAMAGAIAAFIGLRRGAR